MEGFKLTSLLVSVILGTFLIVSPVEGGCRENNMCCKGKNNTCLSRGARMNGDSQISCFCDENCLYMADCCTDYKSHCTAIDCEAGAWSAWGQCSADCGWGTKERKRVIIREAKNGGKECGKVLENSKCYGRRCSYTRNTLSSSDLELRETAKIIPAMYGTWRNNKKYNPYMDIRRNLFNHYGGNEIIKKQAYCAHFEITRARHQCHSKYAQWTRALRKGNTICMECQPFSMKKNLGLRCRGHGVHLQETRWDASTVSGCHGNWVMKEQHQACSCNPSSDYSFIFL